MDDKHLDCILNPWYSLAKIKEFHDLMMPIVFGFLEVQSITPEWMPPQPSKRGEKYCGGGSYNKTSYFTYSWK